jgi:hypothetical protein
MRRFSPIYKRSVAGTGALHELEKKYDEREAIYMLIVIESFALHVAEKV